MTVDQEVQLFRMFNPLMEGWLTKDKGKVLYELVLTYRPSICVEVGTFGGMSEIAIAMALKDNRNGIIFGIDPWKIGPCLEGTNDPANNDWWKGVPWGKIIREYYDKLQEYDILEHTCHLRKHDSDCVEYFKDESINLIHLDSNHSEEVATSTVHRWWKKMAPSCVVVVDDTDWAGQAKSIDVLRDYGCTLIQSYDKYAIYQKP